MPRETPPYGANRPEGRQFPKALKNQPALLDRGWLPEGLWDELDELRNEHHQHLDAVDAAGAAVQELRQRYKDEDGVRDAALVADGKVPEVTPTAERQDALNEADAKHWAALGRFAEFIERATETIKAKGYRLELEEVGHKPESEWRTDLIRLHNEAEKARAEARAALAVADRKVAELTALEGWLRLSETS